MIMKMLENMYKNMLEMLENMYKIIESSHTTIALNDGRDYPNWYLTVEYSSLCHPTKLNNN